MQRRAFLGLPAAALALGGCEQAASIRGGFTGINDQRGHALVIDAGEAAFDGCGPLAAAQRKGCCGQAEKGAAVHQWPGALPHSCS